MNLDTTFKLKAKVEGGRNVTQFKKQLRGLETSSKMSKAQLGKMNIEINRMARAAGNTTRGLKQHISALQLLKSRTEIGSKSYRRLGGEIDRLKVKLKGLDGQANKTGLKIATLVAGIGIGRAVKGTISTAANYDRELRKAAAVEGKGANFGQISRSVEQTAAVAAGTPQQVAELSTTLARAGFSADEIQDSLKGVVKASEAVGVSFSDMGSVASNNIRAFGLETSQTGALMDILVATANNSNQNVLDLGEALKVGAPIAKLFGLSVNDTAATLALLADNGIKASDAGTLLKTGLGRLVLASTGAEGKLIGVSKGNKMLTKAMQALGAEVTDTAGNLKPMDEVIASMKKSLDKFDNQGQKFELMTAIFGKQQAGKFLTLIGNTDERTTAMFENIRKSAGETNETHAAMQSFGMELDKLGGNFNGLQNQIGAMINGALYPFAQALNAAYSFTLKWPNPIRKIGAAFAAAGLSATALAVAIGSIQAIGGLSFVKPIIASLGAMKAGFIGASKAALMFLATNPFGWAVLAVAGITALLVAFPKLRKKLVNFAKAALEFRNKINKFIFDIGKNFLKMINEFIINTLTKLSKIPIIGKIFGKELAKYKQLGKIVVTVSEEGKKLLDKGVNKAKDVTGNVVTNVKGAIDKTNILGSKNVDASGLKGEPEKTNKVLQGMKQGWDEYKAKITDTAAMTKAAMGNALQALEDMFTNFFNTGKLAWQDFTRTILLEIQKIVIRKAIIAPIMSGLEGLPGMSWLKTEANGDAFGANGIVPYRKGGVINNPTMFKYGGSNLGVMGEAGPESIMPLKRGSDGKLGVISHGGKGANVVVNVDASGSSVQGDDQNAAELGRILSSAIEQKLIEAQQPGGLLYS